MNGWARQADWGPCHPDVTVDDHPDGITANWASEKLLGGELKEPFFLGAGIFQPHLPNYAPQEYFDRFPLEEIELPARFPGRRLGRCACRACQDGTQSMAEKNQGDGSVEAGDPGLPRLHGYGGRPHRPDWSQHSRNQSTPTTRSSFLWSDHGFHLGEKGRWGKYSLWERATRVNLRSGWLPGVTTPGTASARSR